MMIEHTVPRYEGEDVMTHPPIDDPRFESFQKILIEHGLISSDGDTALVPLRIMRGVGPGVYLYRAIWGNE